jgi:CRP/FNR family transcriptional regulator, cyclic AMP receptor protein
MTEFGEILTVDENKALESVGGLRQWRRGELILREGERFDWVVVLRAGRVKVASNTAGGSEVVLALRGPGALLGELSAIDRAPVSATVTALEHITALVVPHFEFQRYLQANGRVAYELMRQLTVRLRDADRKRIEFGAFDTTGRVAARLVELAERFGTPTPEGLRIGLPLSQDELAGWTGSSREAVTKALRVLRQEGWIKTGRMHVIVHDLDGLRSRAQ